MNTQNTRLHTITRFGAVAALALGMLTARATPAAAQFPTLYGFGDNTLGQLGNGTANNAVTPTICGFYQHCAALATGYGMTLTLGLDGTLWSTGDNFCGQLGYQTPNYYTTYPQQVPGMNNVISIANHATSMAVKADGSVWAWGYNYSGLLANGTTDNLNHYTPTQAMQYGSPLRPLQNIRTISVGGTHALALDYNGTIWTWGLNYKGQLGTGDGNEYLSAVALRNLPTFKQAVTGSLHSLALSADGTVWAWGWNEKGQLGNGTTTDSLAPVQVTGLNHVASIAAYDACSMAVKEDGTVWYWGQFNGFAGSSSQALPRQIVGLNNIATIALGEAHLLAIDGDNNLWGMGDNSNGQLGDPALGISQPTPARLKTFSSVATIAAGYDYSLVDTYAANMAGNVRLEGIRSIAPVQTISLTFRAAGQPDIVRYADVSADPYVEVDNLPRAHYMVSIKGAKWLQQTVPLDLTVGNDSSLDVTLPAGDANNDNAVDVADFGVLVNAYSGDVNLSGSGYDIRADFNCDGVVDIADFALLVNNYGSVGDN